MKFNIALIISILFLITSCNKSEERNPYSTFQDSDYKKMEQSSIDIELNSTHSIYIHSGYELSKPKYYFQINDETPYEITDSSFVNKKVHGWNGQERLDFEKMKFDLNFDPQTFSVGDNLKLTSIHSGIEEAFVFKVK